MEELIDAMERTSIPVVETSLPVYGRELQEAAEAWATYCLRTHKDALLTRGLAMSEAIAQYITELNSGHA